MAKKRAGRHSKKSARGTGLLLDPFFMEHLVNGPERAERLVAIAAGLASAGLRDQVTPIPSRVATDDEICLVHDPNYLRLVREDIEYGALELSTGDTELSPQSLQVAFRATGGVLQAVDNVMNAKMQNAFCAVRPPGHHAMPAQGMGFCIFNHVAIAARYARKKWGVERIAIVDWDVHHGNGTQEVFYADPSVLFFSSHQWPFYPGSGKKTETGAGKARGLTINAPLPAGSGYAEILGEIETRLEPKLRKFKPELFLISAGFDGRIEDPLGDFTLEDEEFALLTHRVMEWAQDYAGGRIVSILEGGYNLRTLGHTVAAHVKTLRDASPQP